MHISIVEGQPNPGFKPQDQALISFCLSALFFSMDRIVKETDKNTASYI